MKYRILILLALCLALPGFAGCDGGGGPDAGQESSSDSRVEETAEASTEADTSEEGPKLPLGLLPNTLDFAALSQSTVGKEYVATVYESFLASVANHPDQVLHDGESGNYFRALMTDAGEKRHNVALEIIHTEQKKWTWLLVSTEKDFALVAVDGKKEQLFIAGFTEGTVVDQLEYMEKADRDLLTGMIAEQGYETVLNHVRDEFFGQLSMLTEGCDGGYKLGFTGKTHNMWSDDKTLNPAVERDYTVSEIQLVNTEDISEVFTAMEATYDVPQDYIRTLLSTEDEKNNGGREE